jgi:hypothetical protein
MDLAELRQRLYKRHSRWTFFNNSNILNSNISTEIFKKNAFANDALTIALKYLEFKDIANLFRVSKGSIRNFNNVTILKSIVNLEIPSISLCNIYYSHPSFSIFGLLSRYINSLTLYDIKMNRSDIDEFAYFNNGIVFANGIECSTELNKLLSRTSFNISKSKLTESMMRCTSMNLFLNVKSLKLYAEPFIANIIMESLHSDMLSNLEILKIYKPMYHKALCTYSGPKINKERVYQEYIDGDRYRDDVPIYQYYSYYHFEPNDKIYYERAFELYNSISKCHNLHTLLIQHRKDKCNNNNPNHPAEYVINFDYSVNISSLCLNNVYFSKPKLNSFLLSENCKLVDLSLISSNAVSDISQYIGNADYHNSFDDEHILPLTNHIARWNLRISPGLLELNIKTLQNITHLTFSILSDFQLSHLESFINLEHLTIKIIPENYDRFYFEDLNASKITRYAGILAEKVPHIKKLSIIGWQDIYDFGLLYIPLQPFAALTNLSELYIDRANVSPSDADVLMRKNINIYLF